MPRSKALVLLKSVAQRWQRWELMHCAGEYMRLVQLRAWRPSAKYCTPSSRAYTWFVFHLKRVATRKLLICYSDLKRKREAHPSAISAWDALVEPQITILNGLGSQLYKNSTPSHLPPIMGHFVVFLSRIRVWNISSSATLLNSPKPMNLQPSCWTILSVYVYWISEEISPKYR